MFVEAKENTMEGLRGKIEQEYDERQKSTKGIQVKLWSLCEN
jgi:hypothetical protein